MAALRRACLNYVFLLPGLLAILVGGLGLFGWIFDFPLLTRIRADWEPMVPATALCFVLGGLALLTDKQSTHRSLAVAHSLFVWLILLLAGARAVELASGHGLGIEFLLPALTSKFAGSGHMSPQTTTGFLLFAIGMLAIQRTDSRSARILAGMMAGGLLIIGLIAILGYWLDFQHVFELLYVRTGLLWMSLPTATGMVLLGLGLVCQARKCGQGPGEDTVQQQAARISRTTLWVLSATALATGLAGISSVQKTALNESKTDMLHSLNAIRSHVYTSLDNRRQRALVAALSPSLKAAAVRLVGSAGPLPAEAQPSRVAEDLLAHGFSGIGVESGGRRWVMAGHLLPDTTPYPRFNGKTDATLAWDRGYYLRVRVPLPSTRDVAGGFLVLEQPLVHLDRLFAESNSWGTTGTLRMCARLDQKKLLCFPNREQAALHEVADHYEGKPIAMAYALAGKTGVDTLTSYRGRSVLAAYGPVADTALGLVLRKDLSEIYAPIRTELLIVLPLIIFMVALGRWLVRSRVQPLVEDMARAHAAESAARTRFDASIQSSPNGFVIYESMRDQAGEIADFRFAYANRQAGEAAGFSSGDVVGHSLLELFPAQGDVFARYKQVALSGTPLFEEFSLGDGKDSRWFVRQVVAMPGGVAVTFRDITPEKTLLQKLEYSNRLRTAIVESAAYAIISTDVDGTILTFNQAAERMLGYRADELVGKSTPAPFHDVEEISNRAASLSQELGHPVAPGFEVFVAKAKTDLQEEREWTYVRKDGSRFPVRLSVTALRDENGILQGFLGIANDVTEQKRTEEYIRHIALHDALTGLPNRTLLEDRVTVAIEQQRRNSTGFALAMIDIDRFKHINDSMGHHIGDRLLKEFAERVKACLRPADTLARMGGDEFVLLLPDSDAAGAEHAIERIRQALMPPIDVGTQEVHITSSIGISIFPHDGRNLHELLRCADVAMYWVKGHGRNGFKMYSREIDTAATSG